MEEWKDIKGYEGRYQISNQGNVKSIRGGKIRPQTIKPLKISHDVYGYHKVMLGSQQECRRVHRLVAEAFLPNPNEYKLVCHRNDIRDDNRVENLYWGTEKDNSRDREAKGRSKRVDLKKLMEERRNSLNK